ncbi:MAG: MoxR family ATPase [Bauldia sp.]|nr:MoxR family ATPase [Bauldia sp.]
MDSVPAAGNAKGARKPRERAEVDAAGLDRLLAALKRTREEIGKAVVGQKEVVDQLLIALICGGHVLLEGAPGVGKTLLVRTLGAATGLSFARVQFTPDLMPADITGSLALTPDETGHSRLQFQPGPIFTQLLLADEINRATPKTQSSLLEAMQEHTVTAAGRSMALPEPFFVLATQNPVEMEGTYRLPEAQIDRFLFKTIVEYPSASDLDAILDLTTGIEQKTPDQVLSPADILLLQDLVRQVPIADHVRAAIARFAIATQPDQAANADEVRRYFRFGLSPRGAQSLVLAAKGNALLSGRYNVSFDDIRAMLGPVLRHRFQLNYEGEAEGIDPQRVLKGLLDGEVRKAA